MIYKYILHPTLDNIQFCTCRYVGVCWKCTCTKTVYCFVQEIIWLYLPATIINDSTLSQQKTHRWFGYVNHSLEIIHVYCTWSILLTHWSWYLHVVLSSWPNWKHGVACIITISWGNFVQCTFFLFVDSALVTSLALFPPPLSLFWLHESCKQVEALIKPYPTDRLMHRFPAMAPPYVDYNIVDNVPLH